MQEQQELEVLVVDDEPYAMEIAVNSVDWKKYSARAYSATSAKEALELLEAHPERAAILSDYISRLGDDRALPLLQKLAASEDTDYLDYIELRSAIEKLGGDVPEREFNETDPAYEALRAFDPKR